MRRKMITVITAIICAVTCALGLTACGNEKDENDIITASDWTAAFESAQNATRYYWVYDSGCDAEHDFITTFNTGIGYNAEEKQYSRTRANGDAFFWEKDGKYYRSDADGTVEIKQDVYTRYTTFTDREKPFLLSFCKDKFSSFKYYSVSDDGKVEYKAANINIAVKRDNDENTFAVTGTGTVYVTFTEDKVMYEIKAFIKDVDNERRAYRLTDIGTYHNPVFDGFAVPELPQ